MRIITISLAIAICTSSSCDNSKKSHNSKESTDKYPRIIDSMRLNEVYDKTKWLMYCFQCDDTLTFQKKWNDTNKVYFGTLELKFNEVRTLKDETEINFFFIYKGKNTDDDLVRNSAIRGVVYKKGTDSVLYYSLGTDVLPYMKDSCPDPKNCGSRFINPLQPEVVKFIHDHKKELDPWFYKTAQKKGILQ